MVSAPGSPSLHSPDRRKSLMSTAATALPAPVHFSSLRMPEEQLLAIKNKKVREFYKVGQNNARLDALADRNTKR